MRPHLKLNRSRSALAELRVRRGLTLAVESELSGLSVPHLSRMGTPRKRLADSVGQARRSTRRPGFLDSPGAGIVGWASARAPSGRLR